MAAAVKQVDRRTDGPTDRGGGGGIEMGVWYRLENTTIIFSQWKHALGERSDRTWVYYSHQHPIIVLAR